MIKEKDDPTLGPGDLYIDRPTPSLAASAFVKKVLADAKEKGLVGSALAEFVRARFAEFKETEIE